MSAARRRTGAALPTSLERTLPIRFGALAVFPFATIGAFAYGGYRGYRTLPGGVKGKAATWAVSVVGASVAAVGLGLPMAASYTLTQEGTNAALSSRPLVARTGRALAFGHSGTVLMCVGLVGVGVCAHRAGLGAGRFVRRVMSGGAVS
jgi:hypothetical protein